MSMGAPPLTPSELGDMRELAENGGRYVTVERDGLYRLLAANENWQTLAARQLEQFTMTTQKYRAENQRLREALEAFFFEYDSGKEYAGCAPSDPVEQKMREALAGDAE